MGGKHWTKEEIEYIKDNYKKSIIDRKPLIMKGRSHYSILCKATKMGFATNHLSINNPMWKGKNVSFGQLHQWVRRHKVKTNYCQKCGKKNNRLDLANISGDYKRDTNDFEWLCRKCHMVSDGRLDRFLALRIKMHKENKKLRDTNGRFIN